ncbi:hypothetical protein Y032_0018g3495 [Ancylostoma ceylanicum]|uniref:Uncharacterized protein n=1 Tax=Ancylostoma ceylanicum TaxID=53326 RepID=A0A016V2N4_9BILA|nr:hypothetical protein Y032_0018g3495 [Ancylostoma ceylanicum]
MVPERVPDPLKQKFLPLDSSFEIEYGKHIHTRDGCDVNAKYLMDCSGEFTNFVAFYCANALSIRRIHDGGMEAHHIFSDELTVQDVEYMRSSDGGFGLTVALNSSKLTVHPHCVALLRWSGDQLKLLRKLKIEEEVLYRCLRCLRRTVSRPLRAQFATMPFSSILRKSRPRSSNLPP